MLLTRLITHQVGRSAFGRPLHQQPLHQNLLADLCVETEALTLTSLHMASLFDSAQRGDERAADAFRVGVAVTK